MKRSTIGSLASVFFFFTLGAALAGITYAWNASPQDGPDTNWATAFHSCTEEFLFNCFPQRHAPTYQ